MRRTIFLLGVGAAYLGPTVAGQRIRVGELAGPGSVDEAIIEQEQYFAEESVLEEVAPAETDHDAVTPGAAIAQAEPLVPISAVLFSGSPGPKQCRGNPILNINLPKPGSQHSTPKCYNVPGVAQCANFMANEDDGCEAKLFNEPNCLTFANVAVFIPEKKTQGGYFRSIEIRCGVESVTPPPLNLAGVELPANAQQAVGKVGCPLLQCFSVTVLTRSSE